jgi:hypothetical protein
LEKPKPFYERPIPRAVLGAVFALLLTIIGGVVVANLTKDKPSSKTAAIVLEEVPKCEDDVLHVVGNGWNGDHSVEVYYTLYGEPRNVRELATNDGRFTYKVKVPAPPFGIYGPYPTYEVTVRGLQSGTTKKKDFPEPERRDPDGGGCPL